MSKYSIEEFIAQSAQKDDGFNFFDLESKKMLEINLDGADHNLVWLKLGSMVAYRGDVQFHREGLMKQGIERLIKKQFTGEGATLMKATGKGKVYIADYGKQITILDLTDDSITVNGNDLLALAPTLHWDIKLNRRISSFAAGGLFNVVIDGSGCVAITSEGNPLTLHVTPDSPVYTDPNATIAWSTGLTTNLKTNFSLGTFIGRGSGETIQMEFSGEGFVVVQPYEEIAGYTQ